MAKLLAAAALAIYLVLLAGSAIGPVVLWVLHPYPLPPVLAGYLGLVLLGTAFIACGLAASCVSENQVVSAMLTYGVLVFLWFASSNEAAMGDRVAWVVALALVATIPYRVIALWTHRGLPLGATLPRIVGWSVFAALVGNWVLKQAGV